MFSKIIKSLNGKIQHTELLHLISLTQWEFWFAAKPLSTYAYLSLTNTSIYTPTPALTHTHCLKVRLLTATASYDLPARKKKKEIFIRKTAVVCEALGLNASGLPFNTYCQILQFRSDDYERINRLIEILREGIDRKSNKSSAKLLRTKYVVKDYPLAKVRF